MFQVPVVKSPTDLPGSSASIANLSLGASKGNLFDDTNRVPSVASGQYQQAGFGPARHYGTTVPRGHFNQEMCCD